MPKYVARNPLPTNQMHLLLSSTILCHINIHLQVKIIIVACRKYKPSYHVFLNTKAPNQLKWTDSEANICLARSQHLVELNLDVTNLMSCNNKVSAVVGSKLNCTRWLLFTFQVGNKSTRQPLYISNKVDKNYFSKQGCINISILHPNFLTPINPSV